MQKDIDINEKNRTDPAREGTADGNAPGPFVSVMILCYNYGSMLGKALEACAAQTFRDFEVVMINNGSTDDTEAVWRSFCEKHPEIRSQYVFVDPNRGPCHGWNEGLLCARGEYVLFNDADDWMDPDCLEVLAQNARKTGADRVTAQYREVFPDGTVSREVRLSKRDHRIQTVMLQATLFRRSVITENRLLLPETNYHLHSYDMWFIFNFSLVEKTPCSYIPVTKHNYYFNSASLSSKKYATAKEIVSKSFEPKMKCGVEAYNSTEDIGLKRDIAYQLTKHFYLYTMCGYRDYPEEDADKVYLLMRDAMNSQVPGYRRNPMIWWPFGVNSSFVVACSLIALAFFDTFRMKKAIWLCSKAADPRRRTKKADASQDK